MKRKVTANRAALMSVIHDLGFFVDAALLSQRTTIGEAATGRQVVERRYNAFDGWQSFAVFARTGLRNRFE